jgi:hypothetical protein
MDAGCAPMLVRVVGSRRQTQECPELRAAVVNARRTSDGNRRGLTNPGGGTHEKLRDMAHWNDVVTTGRA